MDFLPAGATDVASTASTTIEGRYSCVEVALSADHETAVSGETLVGLTASVYGDWGDKASVTFIDGFNGTKTLGTAVVADVDGGRIATLNVRLAGVGTHVVRATYSGDDWFGTSGSQTVSIEVTGDTSVAASGVGVGYTTFYPYKDSYRDSVAIRGTLQETGSVTIKVYASSGRKVRTFSVSSREGRYSVAWNGRTASGTRVAAGKYRVVQTIRDQAGHSTTFTSYTNVSNKRLYWSTTSITKYADTGSFYGLDYSGYAGYARSSSHSRGIFMSGGTCTYDYDYGDVCDGVFGSYRFTLRSAVQYSSIRISVLGRSYSGYGSGAVGVKDTDGGIDGVKTVGKSWRWYTSGSVGSSGHVGSRHVSGIVAAIGTNEGVMDYQKVRVTYKYAVLR